MWTGAAAIAREADALTGCQRCPLSRSPLLKGDVPVRPNPGHFLEIKHQMMGNALTIERLNSRASYAM